MSHNARVAMQCTPAACTTGISDWERGASRIVRPSGKLTLKHLISGGPSMPQTANDRNLLRATLALQMDLIGGDDLITAMNAWVLEKTKPLSQILSEQGKIAED